MVEEVGRYPGSKEEATEYFANFVGGEELSRETIIKGYQLLGIIIMFDISGTSMSNPAAEIYRSLVNPAYDPDKPEFIHLISLSDILKRSSLEGEHLEKAANFCSQMIKIISPRDLDRKFPKK